MTRSTMLVALLLPWSVQAARGQSPAETPARTGASLLNSKELAKTRRALSQADAGELARERARAARTVYGEYARNFVSGRGSEYSLLDAAAHLREDQLALENREAERFALMDANWIAMWHIADLLQRRYDAGRIGIRENLVCRHARLGADIEMAMTAGQRKGDRSPVVLSQVLALYTPNEPFGGLLDTKRLARAKFAVLRTDPTILRIAQRGTAREAAIAQTNVFLAGWGSYYFLVRWAQRLLDSGTTVATTVAERYAYLEGYWRSLWYLAAIQKARAEAGRIRASDSLEARYYRIGADVMLARAWTILPKKQTQTPSPWTYGGYPFYRGNWQDAGANDLSSLKEMAQAKYAALNADPAEQMRAELRAVRQEYAEREVEFDAGRGTTVTLWNAVRRILEAELILAANVSERGAAHERYLERVQQIEVTQRDRYESGRIPFSWYAMSVRWLRDAELLLLQGRGAAAKE